MKLISADDVIKAVDKHTFETKDGLCLDDDISIILEDVPTIEERKTGMWLHGREIARTMFGEKLMAIDYEGWSCSICGCYCEDWRKKSTYNFCPNCGADMREGD